MLSEYKILGILKEVSDDESMFFILIDLGRIELIKNLFGFVLRVVFYCCFVYMLYDG